MESLQIENPLGPPRTFTVDHDELVVGEIDVTSLALDEFRHFSGAAFHDFRSNVFSVVNLSQNASVRRVTVNVQAKFVAVTLMKAPSLQLFFDRREAESRGGREPDRQGQAHDRGYSKRYLRRFHFWQLRPPRRMVASPLGNIPPKVLSRNDVASLQAS
jgi:hypothetical protein